MLYEAGAVGLEWLLSVDVKQHCTVRRRISRVVLVVNFTSTSSSSLVLINSSLSEVRKPTGVLTPTFLLHFLRRPTGSAPTAGWLVEFCFTSTGTVGLLGTAATSTLTQFLTS